MIFILIIFAFLMMIFSYYIFNKDLMSPSFLVCGGFLLSFLSTAYNVKEWGIDIGINTVVVFVIGMVMFLIGECCIKRLKFKTITESNRLVKPYQPTYIKVGNIKLLLCIAVCAFGLIMTYREVVRIANLNYADWGNLTYNYKTNVVNADLANSQVSSLVLRAQSLTKCVAFVYIFVFVNNLEALRNQSFLKQLTNFRFLIPAILYSAMCIIRGGRFDTIAIILTIVFLLYYYWRLRVGWNKKINIKYIIRVFIIFVAVLVIFWLSKELVGRRSMDTSIMGYITRYVGGSAANFDLYLKDSFTQGNGKYETFAGLLKNLEILGIKIDVTSSHEFRAGSTGFVIGNAYSAIRNYYHDFGIVGVGVMSFLFSALFNFLYYKLKSYQSLTKRKMFLLIWYSSMLYCIVFFFFADYFFPRISIGWVIEMLFLWLTYYYVLLLKIKIR